MNYPQPVDIQAKQGDRYLQLIEHAVATLITLHRQAIAPLPITEKQHEVSEHIRRAIFLLIEDKQDRARIMGKAARQLESEAYRHRLEDDGAEAIDMPPLLE